MAYSSVTLSYQERCFTFAEDMEKVLKGRLSCDCQKSALIREYCDPDFPKLQCGAKITIVSLLDLEGETPRVWQVHENTGKTHEQMG